MVRTPSPVRVYAWSLKTTAPAVADYTVAQATIHRAKTTLDLPCRINRNRDKISLYSKAFPAQRRFIDAISVLLGNIDLQLKHMHGGINGVHMRIENLDPRHAPGAPADATHGATRHPRRPAAQRRHANTIRRRTGKRVRHFLLNKLGDILTVKTKQHKHTDLTAAKRQTRDTHLHFLLSQSVRHHALAGTKAPKP